MAERSSQVGGRASARRRTKVAIVACALLALSACGFATTQQVDDAEVTHTSAVLRGTAYDTKAGPITHWFEYGTTDAYGESTPVASDETTGPGVGVPVQATVTGLDPSTTYHFRLCVKGDDGYGICSDDRTFTTDPDPTPPPCLATFPGPTPYALGDGAEVTATVDCAPITGTISFVCFDFTFVDDLLDPGDQLTLLIDGEPGFGFLNVGPTAQGDRTICSRSTTVFDAFRDGDETFTIDLDPGASVKIASLRVFAYSAA